MWERWRVINTLSVWREGDVDNLPDMQWGVGSEFGREAEP